MQDVSEWHTRLALCICSLVRSWLRPWLRLEHISSLQTTPLWSLTHLYRQLLWWLWLVLRLAGNSCLFSRIHRMQFCNRSCLTKNLGSWETTGLSTCKSSLKVFRKSQDSCAVADYYLLWKKKIKSSKSAEDHHQLPKEVHNQLMLEDLGVVVFLNLRLSLLLSLLQSLQWEPSCQRNRKFHLCQQGTPRLINSLQKLVL